MKNDKSLITDALCYLLNFVHMSSGCRWKLVDSVEPKLNAISFFDIDRPETAVSRWSRAMTKAAMVRIGSLLKESFGLTMTFNSEIEVSFLCW